MVFVKDVGYGREGFAVQQNIVRQNGLRSVLPSVIKNGNVSTLDVVSAVKKALQIARRAVPPGLHISELFGQSVFVSNAQRKERLRFDHLLPFQSRTFCGGGARGRTPLKLLPFIHS
jgi:hypothetical protein